MAYKFRNWILFFSIALLHGKSFAQSFFWDIKEKVLSVKSEANITLLQYDTSKPILTLFHGNLNQKMKFGSYHFKEKISSEENYFFKNIRKINNDSVHLILKSKNNNDTIVMNIFMQHSSKIKVVIQNNFSVLKMKLQMLGMNDEKYYGGGIQCSYVQLNGEEINVYTEENGIGRGDQPITFFTNLFAGAGGNKTTSYAPLPIFFSNKNRLFEVAGLDKMKISFKKKNEISIINYSNKIELDVYYGNTLLEIFAKKYNSENTMKPLPEWAYKPILGIQGGKQKVNKTLQLFEKNEINIGSIWIQDWVGRRKTRFGSQLWWHWQADSSAYPNLKMYADSLEKNRNYKLLGYVNPFVTPNSKLALDKENETYFEKKNGVIHAIKTPGFPTFQVDLTTEKNTIWYSNIIRERLIGNGFKAWMADYAEWNETAHHPFISNWIWCNYLAQQSDSTLFFFNRATANGASKFTKSIWLGDQMTNFGKNDGLPSVLSGLLSGGISGLQNLHADIGAYTNVKTPFFTVKRNKDLLYRSMELCAFTPIMRSHEGLIPTINEQVYDEQNLMMYKRLTNLHNALIPYFKYLSKQASAKGLPYIRPLFLHHESDWKTWDIFDEFLFGADVLVAPVIHKKTFKRDVYIPDGVWVSAWNKQEYEGGKTYSFTANYGYPIVFIKKNCAWEKPLLLIFERLK